MPGPGPSNRPWMADATLREAAGPDRLRAAPSGWRRAPAGPADRDPLPCAGAPDGRVGEGQTAGTDHPPIPAAQQAVAPLIRVDLGCAHDVPTAALAVWRRA